MFKLLKKLLALLFNNNKCFYMNSTNILPPPLDEEEEYNMLIGVSNKDIDSRNTLIIHNLRLVVYIARKFDNTGVDLDDLISVGTFGLIKAVNTFKGDKNIKLATYASRCIENEILMYIRKISGRGAEVSFDEPLNVDWDGNELLLSDVLGTEEDMVMNYIKGVVTLENKSISIDDLQKMNN